MICLPRVVPYSSDNVVLYRYNASMVEDGKEVEIKPLLVNIEDINGVTRSGRVFS